jgi:hypothetical protein
MDTIKKRKRIKKSYEKVLVKSTNQEQFQHKTIKSAE